MRFQPRLRVAADLGNTSHPERLPVGKPGSRSFLYRTASPSTREPIGLPAGQRWLCPGRDSNPYAFRLRGLSSPIPQPWVFVVVHLRLLLRLLAVGERLRIRVNCNYGCNYLRLVANSGHPGQDRPSKRDQWSAIDQQRPCWPPWLLYFAAVQQSVIAHAGLSTIHRLLTRSRHLAHLEQVFP
jgi:hypothetical protein